MCTSLPMPLIAATMLLCRRVHSWWCPFFDVTAGFTLAVPSFFVLFLTCFAKDETASTSKYTLPT